MDARDFIKELAEILKDKQIDISLFVEHFNEVHSKIRDGPMFEEFLQVQHEYTIERSTLLALVSRLRELKELGYRNEGKELSNTVNIEKDRFIGWAEDKYRIWKPFWRKLRKEKEIEKEEKKRKFGIKNK